MKEQSDRGDAVAQDAEHKAARISSDGITSGMWYPWMRQHDLLAMVDRGPVLSVSVVLLSTLNGRQAHNVCA